MFDANNLFMGYISETMSLLILGILLITVTVALRYILNNFEPRNNGEQKN